MTDKSKTTIYTATYDVRGAIENLSKLQKKIREVDAEATRMLKGAVPEISKITARARQAVTTQKGSIVGVSEALKRTTAQVLKMRSELEKVPSGNKAPSSFVRRKLAEEKSARDKLNAAIGTYRKGVKAGEKEATRAAKATARAIERETERAAKRAAKEVERLTKSGVRAQQKLKRAFLSIGKSARSGFGEVFRAVTGAGLALAALHKAMQKIAEAKDDYLRFDEISTAALTIAKPHDDAFRYGAEGAKQFRESVREAANEVKTTAGEMSDAALFWVKAGQKNLDSATALSKVGVLFSRANLDTANNVLEFARGNDILSDMVTMFRKDMSTPERAMESAQTLGEQITAAANSSNVVAEQLFEYSKKVGALFKAGEMRDDEILAISASLASAGLKEESGVHVRKIMTQLAKESTQKLLAESGVNVADENGDIRSFGDIFGELQKVLGQQKPLERMSYLKELFGQRAISTAAALAGLNEDAKGETSIATILEQIQNSKGVMSRNQEEQLKTLSGRIGALADRVTNALGKMFEESAVLSDAVGWLENNLPGILSWIEGFGVTMRDTVIPGIQMAAEEISEWLSPAMSVLSELFGSASGDAEGLADTLAALVRLWVKWKLIVLAVKGLRIVDWFVQLTATLRTATAATQGLTTATATMGATTKTSVADAKNAVGVLPAAFTAAGVGIAAAIAAWGLYDLLTGPVRRAEKRINDFKIKYGKNFEHLKAGDESTASLSSMVRDLKTSLNTVNTVEEISAGGNVYGPGVNAQSIVDSKRRNDDARREIDRLKKAIREQVEKEFDLNRDRTVILPGESKWDPRKKETWGGMSQELPTSLPVWAAEERLTSAKRTGTEQEIDDAVDTFINALRTQGEQQQQAVDKYALELAEMAHELETASDDRVEEIVGSMNALSGSLKENEDALRSTAGRIGDLLNIGKEQADQRRSDDVAERQREKRKSAFRGGGKSKQLDPYASSILTSLDRQGNRRIHLGMKQGNAATVFQESPQMRELLQKSLNQKPGITSVRFGDYNWTITANSNAKPEDIARVVNREMRRVGERNTREIQRIIGTKAARQF